MTAPNQVAANPKEAFELYLEKLQKEYYPWYDKASDRLKLWWGVGRGIAIMASVAASTLAATLDTNLIMDNSSLRVPLVLLPIIGTIASSILLETRVRDLLSLRSDGLEAMQNLIEEAKARFAAAQSNTQQLSEIHLGLIANVSKVEREQAMGFRAIIPVQSAAVAETTIAPKPPGRRDVASDPERDRAAAG
jgi:hypothetical protein